MTSAVLDTGYLLLQADCHPFTWVTAFIELTNICIYTILPKVLGHSLLMKDLTTLVISMSTNLKGPVQTVAIQLAAHNSLQYHYILKH